MPRRERAYIPGPPPQRSAGSSTAMDTNAVGHPRPPHPPARDNLPKPARTRIRNEARTRVAAPGEDAAACPPTRDTLPACSAADALYTLRAAPCNAAHV